MTFTAGKDSYQRLRTLMKITKNLLKSLGESYQKKLLLSQDPFYPLDKGIMATFITFTVLKYKLHFYS